MKYLLVICILFISNFTIAQKIYFHVTGRSTPTIQKDFILKATTLTQIMPNFYKTIKLPYKDVQLLNKRAAMFYGYENFNFGQNIVFDKQENKYSIIEALSYNATTIVNGKKITLKNIENKLSETHKIILSKIDIGAPIEFTMLYKYKSYIQENDPNLIREAKYTVTVIPTTEAQYINGYKGMSEYINTTIFNKFSEIKDIEELRNALVQFTVNENGEVILPQLLQVTNNTDKDKLILESLQNMPKWQPAKNRDNKNIKQVYTISFGYSGGC